jgi:hypothetical protein
MAYKVLSQSGDTAMVQFLDAGPPKMNPQTRQMMPSKLPPPVKMVRVSGKWLPENVVKEWKDQVASAKSQVDFMMPSIAQGLTFVIPVVSSLANAKTQQEFNMALQQIMPFLPKLGGPPGGQGMAGMPGGNMGNGQPYDSSGSQPYDSSGGQPGGPNSGGTP